MRKGTITRVLAELSVREVETLLHGSFPGVRCRENRWTRLVFFHQPGGPVLQHWEQLRQCQRLELRGGSWLCSSSAFTPYPCVPSCEWHNTDRWEVTFVMGEQVAVCEFACESSQQQPMCPWRRSQSCWSCPLAGTLSVEAQCRCRAGNVNDLGCELTELTVQTNSTSGAGQA